GTGLFSLPREHGSSAQGGHFLAHRGRAACLLREWERRAEGAGAGTQSLKAECRVSRAQRKGDAGGASNTVRRSAGTGGGGGQGG
ncbi:unnamed protein product, partial [Prorocentrum cordatum]